MKAKKYISKERIKLVHESLGFLYTYEGESEEIHHVGPNIDVITQPDTDLLHELGEINRRRKDIISKLLDESN